ncbi:ATP-binding protein [Brevibacillus ginsengisoli]|uniref:ATP-binding protein n=1 Tax=Brevibacillus ginsengisoli TaxID=363854 RepID=UPI003CEDC7DA
MDKHPVLEVINGALSANTKMFPTDIPHYCQHCGRHVPKLEVELFPGVKKTVQPVCKCESESHMKELREMEQYQERKEAERRFSLAKVGERFKDDVFENFTKRQGSEQAFNTAKEFAEGFSKQTDTGLYIFGPPGNGKTKLAGSIVNALSKKGHFVIYEKATKLLQRIRDTFDQKTRISQTQIMKDIRICDVLVLDDICVDKSTEWVEQTLYEIIDTRYEDKKPVVFTSNVPASKLVQSLPQGATETMVQNRERVQDRIYEMCTFVKNSAVSYRKELADKRMKENGNNGNTFAG